MLFFRVMLCVVGLLLYLVIREFSDEPATPGANASPPVPPVAAVETIPTMPWDAATIGTFQPVAAKPADPLR